MLKVSTSVDGVTYGDNRITSLFMGKLVPGSLVLLHGESGTGKSILCQQLAHNLLCNETGAIAYFTSDSKPQSLLDKMESFSFHVHYHFLADRFRVYPLQPLNNSPSPEEAVKQLLECLEELPRTFTLAIVDSVNPLLAAMNAESQMSLLHDIKVLCNEQQRSVIMVTSPHAFNRHTLPRLFSLCDYLLKTDYAPATPGLWQIDCRSMRTLEVGKLGGVEVPWGTLLFEIRAGSGIHILPYVVARA